MLARTEDARIPPGRPTPKKDLMILAITGITPLLFVAATLIPIDLIRGAAIVGFVIACFWLAFRCGAEGFRFLEGFDPHALFTMFYLMIMLASAVSAFIYFNPP